MSKAGAALSEPLLRDRPLWHLYFLPRLEDDRLGMVFKMRRALVDGKSAVELGLLLFHADLKAKPISRRKWKPGAAAGRGRPRRLRARWRGETVWWCCGFTRSRRPGWQPPYTVRARAVVDRRPAADRGAASFLDMLLLWRRRPPCCARIEEADPHQGAQPVTVDDVLPRRR